MEWLQSLYASHYFSTVHLGLAILHVTAALVSLLVAPVAMVVSKGGKAHRQWGLVYFWGMVAVNSSALVLLVWRFNMFLFGITVLTLYAVVTGYRSLRRKRPQQGDNPTLLDWGLTYSALLVGAGLAVWGIATLLGLTKNFIPSGGSTAFILGLLPLIFGVGILQNVLVDLRMFRNPPTDRNWWWYYHMDRMLGSYLGLFTALMVQQVGPRLPESYAWIVWVAPTLIGTPLVSRWITHYRTKFDGKRQSVSAAQAGGVTF